MRTRVYDLENYYGSTSSEEINFLIIFCTGRVHSKDNVFLKSPMSGKTKIKYAFVPTLRVYLGLHKV